MKNKFKNIFFDKASLMSSVVFTNNQIGIVHDACKSCWDKAPENSKIDMLKYIGKRISSGHESVIEHSNIIMLITMNRYTYTENLVELLTPSRYLYTKVEYDGGNAYLLIGGSIRGYKNLFRNIDDITNPILNKIKETLYECSYKEFFLDFIDSGLMDENRFILDPENGPYCPNYCIAPTSDKVEFINIDPVDDIYEILQDMIGDIFSYNDLLDMCSATILFKDMARIITQQLTRHRNGITQESQRYVDYSDAKFVSPEEFNDNYKDKKYNIKLFDSEVNVTMSDLGKELIGIYGQLRNQDVMKQDARGFLPLNAASTKVYMTFTYRTLIKFLELRTDPAAQAEIRAYANIIEEEFINHIKDILGENVYKYLIPKYMLQEVDYDYSAIDEVLEEVEE